MQYTLTAVHEPDRSTLMQFCKPELQLRSVNLHVYTTTEAANPVELPKHAFTGFDDMTKRVLPEAAGSDGSGDAKKSEGEACMLHAVCKARCDPFKQCCCMMPTFRRMP